MTAIPFALVSAEDRDRVVAYGLDIELASGRDVVTFRRDGDGRSTVTVHRSVEDAVRRYQGLTPVELEWET
ncbi:hypothetical protein BLA60_34380 [Actinophytocola xinjiangensis]|uniref:Uncharacterized protein n=1 Tax=Actinophytocola xinjiangensis TaxID=485602 RepID=A0A7Z0WF60_9PSEU|nr:hypothetical protein [Actinophytocola xinjiangensis]OLF05870.1 hypothetical protein BLA60_34380 [Actinophytocola xinjiangensis]